MSACFAFTFRKQTGMGLKYSLRTCPNRNQLSKQELPSMHKSKSEDRNRVVELGPKAVVPKRSEKAGAIAAHMREVIRELGEDPEREGLLRTPERAEGALKFLTSGYDADI